MKFGVTVMTCMKCGRASEDKQVFCPACLAEMEKYPVKPGTPANIPVRPVVLPPKKTPKAPRFATPEEHIAHLRKSRRNWAMAFCVALLLLGFFATALFQRLFPRKTDTPLGQNYGTAQTSTGAPKR